MSADYEEQAIKALEMAHRYADKNHVNLRADTVVWVLLIKAVVFALLEIAEIVWKAADKMLYPGSYHRE
jgi:hypothetical protein